MMLYMFLLYSDPERPFPEDGMEKHFALARETSERNAHVSSEALRAPETARIVRIRDGAALTTDRPFAETEEVFGGFYILDCKDWDDALGYAERIPDAVSGAVEIREVWKVPEKMRRRASRGMSEDSAARIRALPECPKRELTAPQVTY